MSKVNLSTVLFYRGDDDHKPTEAELVLAGVGTFFREIRFPEKGMTFLYGHNNPAIPHFLRYAGDIGLDAAVVDVHVEIGNWLRHKVDLSDSPECGLGSTRFLNLTRAKRDVVDLLETVSVKQLGPERAAQDEFGRGATTHPYLMDSVIELPEFKHLAVVAYSVRTAAAGDIQVATVFDDSAITAVDGGHRLMDVQIVL
ncbi:hypothetical protein [Pseudomonas sp.]|uniref:hypothetical protein n=1 Tax=Pseudomonas sp. TaxID=306 RepID=UPI002908D580|nr:hypothetical protein [Pseudomonas sp.]MDU4254451.1 hypothetical protein [Pseudomonas sp.]